MKRDEIIEHLKSRILSGEIPAGSFLPHRAELLEYCGASNVTVQRAVNHLVEAEKPRFDEMVDRTARSQPSRRSGVSLLLRVAGNHGVEDAAASVSFRDPDPFREPSGGEGLRLPLVVDSCGDG